jgi:hypothetical protein
MRVASRSAQHHSLDTRQRAHGQMQCDVLGIEIETQLVDVSGGEVEASLELATSFLDACGAGGQQAAPAGKQRVVDLRVDAAPQCVGLHERARETGLELDLVSEPAGNRAAGCLHASAGARAAG